MKDNRIFKILKSVSLKKVSNNITVNKNTNTEIQQQLSHKLGQYSFTNNPNICNIVNFRIVRKLQGRIRCVSK